MKTEFWYSVENGGDGSAYPIFMESRELAEIHQEYMDEGWGEPCVGHEVIESALPIKMLGLVTAEEMKKEIEDDLNESYSIEERVAGKYPDFFKRMDAKLAAINELIERK